MISFKEKCERVALAALRETGIEVDDLKKCTSLLGAILLNRMNRYLILVGSIFSLEASATGVSFGSGTAGLWIGMLVIAVGIIAFSIYGTHLIAKKTQTRLGIGPFELLYSYGQ